MRWYAISGSWRRTDERVEKDVEEAVYNIVSNGDGILTGGALGVDYLATNMVLEKGDVKNQLRVYLPVDLETYKKHFLKRKREGVINSEQAEKIIGQLGEVYSKCPNCILDKTNYLEVSKESYHARNTSIVEDCDEIYAFQVNESRGTEDAIDKARKLGKPIHVKKYTIQK